MGFHCLLTASGNDLNLFVKALLLFYYILAARRIRHINLPLQPVYSIATTIYINNLNGIHSGISYIEKYM